MESSNLSTLVEKYQQSLPRYTSYPTAAELAPCEDTLRVNQALAAAADLPLNLYVHLPFCEKLCWFCACNKIVTQDHSVAAPYLQALSKECELITTGMGKLPTVCSIHLGGGSPTFLSPTELAILCGTLEQHFSNYRNASKSVELDPRSATQDKIFELSSHGFTRASIGVQDFDTKVQQLVHRIQPFESVSKVIRALRNSGFNGINFDLIYGLPGQTKFSMAETINRVIELRPDRIAMYQYAHVAWKAAAQSALEKHGIPSCLESVQLFLIAEQLLIDAGYDPIGMDHFALPTDELSHSSAEESLHRNFMGYTSSESGNVLGVGVSAISDLNGFLLQNHTQLPDYYQKLNDKELPVAKSKERSADDAARAMLIEKIMCKGGIYFDELDDNFERLALHILQESRDALNPLIADGLVVWDSYGIRATYTGRLFLRSIAAALDRYLPGKHLRSFSKAI